MPQTLTCLQGGIKRSGQILLESARCHYGGGPEQRPWTSDLEPQRIRALDAGEEHPYGERIAEYSGTEFQTAAQAATERLDALTAGGVTAERFDSLVEIFRAATRLEAAFWQQALDSLK